MWLNWETNTHTQNLKLVVWINKEANALTWNLIKVLQCEETLKQHTYMNFKVLYYKYTGRQCPSWIEVLKNKLYLCSIAPAFDIKMVLLKMTASHKIRSVVESVRDHLGTTGCECAHTWPVERIHNTWNPCNLWSLSIIFQLYGQLC